MILPLKSANIEITTRLMGPDPIIILQGLEKFLPVSLADNSLVVDLACGKGLSLEYFANKYTCSILGIDAFISEEENAKYFLTSQFSKVYYKKDVASNCNKYCEKDVSALFCINSFHYFYDEQIWDNTFSPCLSKNAFVLFTLPTLKEDLEHIPERLKPYWTEDMIAKWKNIAFWKTFFSERLDNFQYGIIPNIHEAWQAWENSGDIQAKADSEMMKKNNWEYLNFYYFVGNIK